MFIFPRLFRLDNLDELKTGHARISMWQQIITKTDFNFVFGNGTGTLKEQKILPMIKNGEIVGYFQSQNYYLLLLCEVGLTGLLLWMFGITAYILKIWQYRSDPMLRKILVYIALLIFIQFLENDLFLSSIVAVILGFGIARTKEIRGEA